jgi:hypothetical protein
VSKRPRKRLSAPPAEPAAVTEEAAAGKAPQQGSHSSSSSGGGAPADPGISGLREMLSLDLRSIALFRILLGGIILLDLIWRLPSLEAFYTDFGVLPREMVTVAWHGAAFFGFHQYFSSVPGVLLLFLVNAVFAVMLLVGWRTRLATVVCWLFLISLQNRNPMVLQGGDVLLRVLVFWGMFLPLGAYLSVDCRSRRPQPGGEMQVFSAGTVALILQVCLVYIFTALLKSSDSWRTTGDAVYLALQLDAFRRPLGTLLLPHHGLLRVATHITLFFEAFGPLFLFYPVRNGPVRTAVVFSFWFFHLVALNLCMDVGPFPYICAVAWTVLLPAWFWERAASVWRRMAIPPPLRRRAEAFVARNLPHGDRPPYPTRLAWPLQAIVCLCLLGVLLWNLRTLDFKFWSRIFPRSANFLLEVPHIDQYWGMFAPKPTMDGGWYVIPGKLRNGTEIDLLRDGAPVSWEKPGDVIRSYRSERWRKYLMNLWDVRNSRYRLHYARYLARLWNRDHYGPEELCTFEICYMRQDSQRGFKPTLQPKKVVIWRHWCFPEFAPKPATAKSGPPTPITGPAVTVHVPAPSEGGGTVQPAPSPTPAGNGGAAEPVKQNNTPQKRGDTER